MDARTLKALKSSIEHWEANVAAETWPDVTTGADHCKLCLTFEDCEGCPVLERTGRGACENTPYSKAYFAWKRWRLGTGSREAFRTAAQAEIDFLRSLLPTEEGL